MTLSEVPKDARPMEIRTVPTECYYSPDSALSNTNLIFCSAVQNLLTSSTQQQKLDNENILGLKLCSPWCSLQNKNKNPPQMNKFQVYKTTN